MKNAGKKAERTRQTALSRSARPALVLLALIVFAAQAPAQFDRTSMLINVPTADVLSHGSLAASLKMSLPLIDPSESNNAETEFGGVIRFSPLKRLELALTAYTLSDYVLGMSYRLIGDPGDFGLALGINDIGLNRYVSPLGNGEDDAWPDWKYRYYRQPENFSAFAVTTIPVTDFARFHLGMGRGRFVGYERGKYLNTDYFFDEPNDWALGLFGGAEINIGKHFVAGFDVDGRDVNAGIKAFFGPVNLSVAATKLEGWTARPERMRFGRLAVAAGYEFDGLFRSRPKPPPVTPVPVVRPEPPPEPAPEPEPEPVKLALEPVYFMLDVYTIQSHEPSMAVLRRNVDMIKQALAEGREFTIVIDGHTCPIATPQYNIALGNRRAEWVRQELVRQGVDGRLLSTESYGETRLVTTDPAQSPREKGSYSPNRRAEFRVEER